MVAQAVKELPNECCGLLAGQVEPALTDRPGGGPIGRVIERFPLANAAGSPVEYSSDPRGMFDACRTMRERGWDILAVYHSHPASDPIPSRTDLDRDFSPDVMNLIISLKNGEPLVKGWWLAENGYREADWEIV
jgi:proteasome lid subunit RPN8/RPN11